MKNLLWRIYIFIRITIDSWRHMVTDNPFKDKYYDERNMTGIDPRFAWAIAGIHVEYDDELSKWEELK